MKTILLVEDEALIALDTQSILQANGFHTIVAYNGRTAVDKAVKEEIDLVLMDIDLGRGRMDGTEAAQRILKRRDIPIVFLTSHSEKKMVEKVKGITRYGYVLKSAGRFVLIESINTAFELFEAHQKAKEGFRKLEDAYNIAGLGQWELDITTDNLKWSSGIYSIFEIDPEVCKASRSVFLQMVHPEDRDFVDTVYRNSVENRTPYNIVHRILLPSGKIKYVNEICRTEYAEDGTPLRSIGTVQDITRLKQTENELRSSEEKYRFFFENIPISVHVTDENLVVQEWNKAAEELFGYGKDEMIGKDMFTTTYSDLNETQPSLLKKILQESLEDGKKRDNVNYNRTKDGRDILCEWIDLPYKKNDEIFILSVAKDISEENRLLTELEKSLEEKDILIREVHHRVKNNLAMISALIALKAQGSGSEEDFSDIQNQVAAIQLIHEKLYKNENITSIDFRVYVDELLGTIFASFYAGSLTVENNIGRIFFNAKTAVPLGLLINEIATNAIKHGFRENEMNRFTVAMRQDADGRRYLLRISNTGKQFPGSVHLHTAQSLGLRLITVLVEQLNGSIELRKHPETAFLIDFPIEQEP